MILLSTMIHIPLLIIANPLLQLLILFFNLLSIASFSYHGVAAEGGLQFSYASGFSNTSSIINSGSVQFSNSTMWMLYDPSTPSTNTSNNLIGRAAYKQPMAFTSNSSFSTAFSFQIIVTGENQTKDCPSGIAFFLSPDGATPPVNSGGRYFGLVDPASINSATNSTASTDPFFAVVFDSAKDSATGINDPSDSYIGIDFSSLIPTTFVDTSTANSGYYPELYLCSNSTFTVHISYNASSQTTQVWMTNSASNATTLLADPASNTRILDFKQDLFSTVLSKASTWYVGFSVTNYNVGSPPARVAILSWFFNVDNTGSGNNSTKLNQTVIIVVVVVAVVLLIGAIVAAILISRRIRKARSSKNDGHNLNIQSVANLQRFSYRDLKTSTGGFDPKISLIGEGGFSKVYKGTLPDGSVVAIKRLKDSLGKETEFASELRIIGSIRHRNLLQLEGWSYDKGEALLVYKFMSNGSLERYLFGNKRGTLDGDTRLQILQGVAAALEYLHCGLGECILHRDIKAANVMLTEDFEAVLGDFGLARLIKHNEIVTATMVGTPGYVAPEVFMTGKVTDKADVYSYGVLMLEVACGSTAINRSSPKADYLYLAEWISRLHSSENVIQGLDPTILKLAPESQISLVEDQWKHVLQLALLCCNPAPGSRPAMRFVNQYLQDLINSPSVMPSLSFKSHSMAPTNLDDEDRGYLDYLNFFSKQTLNTSNFTSITMPSSSSNSHDSKANLV